MDDYNIQCPSCSYQFPLTQSIAGPMLEAERQRHAAEVSQMRAEQKTERDKLAAEKKSIEEQRDSLDEQAQKLVSQKLEDARKRIRDQEAKRLAAENEIKNQESAQELALLKQQLEQRNTKLAEERNEKIELLKKTNELEDAKREMPLAIQKAVTEAKAEAEQKAEIKIREKEEQMAGMNRQIEELKRRGEQGSQQTQGEALELLLEDKLTTSFLRDRIVPVPKGVSGADLVQHVTLDSGGAAGIILWESKATKSWSSDWLPKLREDQRKINAHISVLVSQTLPAGVTSFALVDGVWVTSPRYAVELAHVIRRGIVDTALARKISEGQESKMELVYQYLTGTGFRTRVEGIVERFTELSEELDKEKRFMGKKWARQEKQLEAVRAATLGLHGDLQGIAGSTVIPELDSIAILTDDED